MSLRQIVIFNVAGFACIYDVGLLLSLGQNGECRTFTPRFVEIRKCYRKPAENETSHLQRRWLCFHFRGGIPPKRLTWWKNHTTLPWEFGAYTCPAVLISATNKCLLTSSLSAQSYKLQTDASTMTKNDKNPLECTHVLRTNAHTSFADGSQ